MIRLLLSTESPADGSGAGYSETPLLRKLGIKPGWRLLVIRPPENYWELLGKLPAGNRVLAEDSGTADPKQAADNLPVEFIHLFAIRFAELERTLQTYQQRIVPHGMIWVSWPKKSSGIRSDLDENRIRNLALQHKLVDVKAAAIDPTWSGIKLVVQWTESTSSGRKAHPADGQQIRRIER